MTRCEKCRYWLNANEGRGECHANPPTVVATHVAIGNAGTSQLSSAWPMTTKHLGCGRGKRKRSFDMLYDWPFTVTGVVLCIVALFMIAGMLS